MTNIIDIYFDSVGSTATAPSKLWQWSKGQIVRINGLDLPAVYQVHFSNNPTLGTAEPVAVSGNMVSIPDIYLTTGEPVYLFIWLSDETSAETIRKGTIYVAKRSQPSGEYDPTAEQQTIIDGLIGSINTAVDTAEGYADSAQTYSGNAATSATEALNAKDAAQGYAEQASQTAQGVEIFANRAEDAADDAETAKQDVEQLKQAVEGFANDAESAKTDAETARGEAQGFAQAASEKASEALQSASQANQSATIATAQAQTATAKATEASQSADVATSKASEASASATTATTKASEASTSASTATTAKNDAVTAKNAAVTAKTGAETARTGAEAAAQSVSASAAQIATNTSDITDLKEDLDDLTADVSEIQSDGIVPTARQLLSDKYAVDQTPYKYRASYSGDRMNDEIVGGSIVWNQLVNSASVTLQSGHKYISKIGTAWTVETSTGTAITGLTSGSDMITDLTTMFGTEVANYIYGLEQADAGAGVAWFKKLFPKDYYEYSEPTLKHVEGVSAHETVGFNQWDEEWEVGRYDAYGNKTASATEIRAKNKIRVFPDTYYSARFDVGAMNLICFYDSEEKHLSNSFVGTSGDTFKTPSNAQYMTFKMNSAYGKTYSHDICINISDPSRNGEYEPYVKHSYPLDGTLTLRGIPKLGSNGLYFDGDRYLADGTVERRYGIVDLGTLPWVYYSGTAHFYVTLSASKTTGNNFICSKYLYGGVASQNDMANKATGFYRYGNIFRIKDTAYTDAATFKEAMSGVMLVYELATPTTETAQPFQNPQIVDASGTEEYVSTSIVPIGHYTKYYDDLRKKLDGLPWNLDMIAPEETGTTASQAYAIGKYFILDNQLCKAKTAIASGATFTLNTNYEVTTVADELYAALHS